MRIKAWIMVAALVSFHPVHDVNAQEAARTTAPANFAGTWLPDARRADAWPKDLPLAPVARRFMQDFDPDASDPTTFCMPMGTPRNMLQTAYPLEIVQTPQRLVIVLQPNLANAEVRRIPLDGRELPAAPDPSWYGTSRGRWEGATLRIETSGLREDAIISENGLPHSGQLRVIERLRIVNDGAHGKVLIDDIELHDPQAYLEPLRTRRYFSWAPNARLHDGTCVEALWIDKLWRDRLQEHAQPAHGESPR
ncbi:MAG: hypothetical protein ABI616_01235 [Pseudomonadota bacterium]